MRVTEFRNGVKFQREATPEEVVEYNQILAETHEEQPTQADRIEAQVMYTALMTDTLLEE